MTIVRTILAASALAAGVAHAAACSRNDSGGDASESHRGHAHESAAGAHQDHEPAAANARSRDALRKITPSTGYPLKTCVVSGDELGAMGDTLAYEYEGREIQLCCEGCIDEFLGDPAKFLAKLPETAK